MTFDMFKNIIIEQNKQFLEAVSKKTGLDYDELTKNYLKPEYYLPIIKKKVSCQSNTNQNTK